MKIVVFCEDVEEDLYSLFQTLYDKGYLGTYDFAWQYVQDLVDYITSGLESKVWYDAPEHFSRYGMSQKYIVYQRNQNTSWYVFFEEYAECYLVTHITNNHVSGQFIR